MWDGGSSEHPIWGVCPQRIRSSVLKPSPFLVVVFIAGKKQRQPKWPLTNEWINKMWLLLCLKREGKCNIG